MLFCRLSGVVFRKEVACDTVGTSQHEEVEWLKSCGRECEQVATRTWIRQSESGAAHVVERDRP